MAGLFVNQLTVIDFSYLHASRGILGESWIVDLELYGDLNPESMVFDFSHVKKQLKQVIDHAVDHKFVIAVEQPGLKIELHDHQYLIQYQPTKADDYFDYQAPEQAITVLRAQAVDEQSLCAYLQPIIEAAVPDNVYQVKLSLRPECLQPDEDFYYHYSHGLKHHFGDCQRMIHGHRSKIKIYQDGSRNRLEEKRWAQRWQGIYLGSDEDLTAENSAESEFYSFAYRSEQGFFQLKIHKSRCEILPTDTTVECIADFIAAELKAQFPLSSFEVRAFEGIDKGAIAV